MKIHILWVGEDQRRCQQNVLAQKTKSLFWVAKILAIQIIETSDEPVLFDSYFNTHDSVAIQ